MRAVVLIALMAGVTAMPFEAEARPKFRLPSAKASPSPAPSSAASPAKHTPDTPSAGAQGSSRTTVIVMPRIGRGSSSSDQTEDGRANGQGQVFKAGMRPFVAPSQTGSAAEAQAGGAAQQPVRGAVPVLGSANVERVAVPSFQKLN